MQVQIIGITKEMKSKKENPNDKFFVVVVGYSRPDMHGFQTRSVFLTNEMIEKATFNNCKSGNQTFSVARQTCTECGRFARKNRYKLPKSVLPQSDGIRA